MPCFTGRRASSRSYVVFWVSPKWSHSFPGRHRSPLGLAPFVIDTPSVDVMGHARQASSTYARFDRLDIASGGRQRPSHFHPIVDTHPHTHTPIFSTQSSLVVTHAYAVGTGGIRSQQGLTLSGSWEPALSPLGLKRWGFVVHLYRNLVCALSLLKHNSRRDMAHPARRINGPPGWLRIPPVRIRG